MLTRLSAIDELKLLLLRSDVKMNLADGKI